MKVRSIRTVLVAGAMGIVAFGLLASQAAGAIVIFDDANQNGWTRPWFTGSQTGNVHTGTTALNTANGQIAFDHPGFSVGNNWILEMWINTSTPVPATRLQVQLSYTGNANRPFDGRNISTVYEFDGSMIAWGTDGITTDSNTATWQLLRLDLTQKTYTGFPFNEHQFDPANHQITRIMLRSEGGESGNLIADNVSLVPEPASLGLFALYGLLLRRRRGRDAL
jgi:hypothetical protein